MIGTSAKFWTKHDDYFKFSRGDVVDITGLEKNKECQCLAHLPMFGTSVKFWTKHDDYFNFWYCLTEKQTHLGYSANIWHICLILAHLNSTHIWGILPMFGTSANIWHICQVLDKT